MSSDMSGPENVTKALQDFNKATQHAALPLRPKLL